MNEINLQNVLNAFNIKHNIIIIENTIEYIINLVATSDVS